jgi:hypothetical protein
VAKEFKTPAAFKTALEAHLRRTAADRGLPFQTLQLKYVIERLLARLFHSADPPWLLKGGFAMDLRFRPRSRTTKDVDLSVKIVTGTSGPASAGMREKLQEALDVDLGDHLTFRIAAAKKELTNAPGGGGRFGCEAVLLGKTYASFHIDVGVGDATVGVPEQLIGDDTLAFAGIAPAVALAIPKPQQFAEKIHAYTFPWAGRLNTRTRDLVDMVILVERGQLHRDEVREAMKATFATRGTHPLPTSLTPPPEAWRQDFPGMAGEANISTTDYLEAYGILERYWAGNDLGE